MLPSLLCRILFLTGLWQAMGKSATTHMPTFLLAPAPENALDTGPHVSLGKFCQCCLQPAGRMSRVLLPFTVAIFDCQGKKVHVLM